MVKVWGYDPVNGPERPSRSCSIPFTTKCRSTGAIQKRVMKLPSAHDIQRTLIARHLMMLNHVQIRQGFRKWPTDFRDKLIDFRRQGSTIKWSGRYGGRLKYKIRKERKFEDNEEKEAEKLYLDSLSYKTCVPDWIKETVKTHVAKPSKKRRRVDKEALNVRTMRRWKVTLVRDMKADRVNEILGNLRMVSTRGEDFGYQPLYTICLECAIYALKVHDWAGLANALCRMVDLCSMMIQLRSNHLVPSVLNVLWSLGFLVSVNNLEEMKNVEQFAEDVTALLGGQPLWIGSQLSAWMIQKGYAPTAHRLLLKECSRERGRSTIYKQWLNSKTSNSKRDLIIYISELVKGVHNYSIWKRDNSLTDDAADPQPHRRLTRARQRGETALDVFEICLAKAKEVEGDVMSFIEPYVELVVEYRSPENAKKVLDEIFNSNDGNFFMETFYIQFLEEYFSNTEDDKALLEFLKRRTERKFIVNEGKHALAGHAMRTKGKRMVENWKASKKAKGEIIETMKVKDQLPSQVITV